MVRICNPVSQSEGERTAWSVQSKLRAGSPGTQVHFWFTKERLYLYPGKKIRDEGLWGFCLFCLVSSLFCFPIFLLFSPFSCKWWILTLFDIPVTSLSLSFKQLFQRHDTLQLLLTFLVLPVVFIAVNYWQFFYDIKSRNLYFVVTSFLTYVDNLFLNHLKKQWYRTS